MENVSKSFKSQIDSASSILVLLPKDPYLDQVAAGLSLYLGLKDKKDISIVCPSPMLVEYNRLVGIDKVIPDVGNKNLVFKIKDFNPDNIERVTYDVDTSGEMQLVLIPKLTQKPPTKDHIVITYSGISADTVILIGGMNESHFPEISSKDFSASKLIHIGNHELKTSNEKEILSFATTSSSVSEIVASLLVENEITIDADIATNLLMGIGEGSKNFTHREITAQTFELVANLMKKGGKLPSQQQPVQQFSQPKVPFPPFKPASEFNPLERPQGESVNTQPKAPQSWTQTPKIFKGTSIS